MGNAREGISSDLDLASEANTSEALVSVHMPRHHQIDLHEHGRDSWKPAQDTAKTTPQLPDPTTIYHSTNYREMCIANVPGISRTAVLLRGATRRSPLHRDDTYSYCTSRTHTSTHTECMCQCSRQRVCGANRSSQLRHEGEVGRQMWW